MKLVPHRAGAWLDRHPWLALSLLLHAVALLALWLMTPLTLLPDGAARVSTPQQKARVSASLQQARQQQMQRQIRELERVASELAGEAQVKDSALPQGEAALRERARQLSQRVHAADQQRRATELAQLLKIPREEALRRVQSDPRSAPPRPQASLTELAQDAKARLHAAQAREQARQQGQPGQSASSSKALGASKSPGAARAGAGGGGGPEAQAVAGTGTAGHGAGGIGQLAGGNGQGERRSYGDLMALDAAPGRVGQGRRIGPGGEAAQRVLLDRWYLVGPFEGRQAYAIDTAYPPELAVDLDAVYEGKDGRLLAWAPLLAPPYPLVPDPRHADAVYYAVTEVHSERAQTVFLDLGADDDAKLWLNDELVWHSARSADKPWYRAPWMHLTQRLTERNLSEARIAVTLRPGPNRLMLKLYNGIDLTFFSVVLVAAD